MYFINLLFHILQINKDLSSFNLFNSIIFSNGIVIFLKIITFIIPFPSSIPKLNGVIISSKINSKLSSLSILLTRIVTPISYISSGIDIDLISSFPLTYSLLFIEF